MLIDKAYIKWDFCQEKAGEREGGSAQPFSLLGAYPPSSAANAFI